LITGDFIVDTIYGVLVDVKELQELLHGNKLFLDNQQIADELFYGLDNELRKAIIQELKPDLRKLSDRVHLLRDNGGSSYAPKLFENADGLQGKESTAAMDGNHQAQDALLPNTEESHSTSPDTAIPGYEQNGTFHSNNTQGISELTQCSAQETGNISLQPSSIRSSELEYEEDSSFKSQKHGIDNPDAEKSAPKRKRSSSGSCGATPSLDSKSMKSYQCNICLKVRFYILRITRC
jgi:hypothetical protein